MKLIPECPVITLEQLDKLTEGTYSCCDEPFRHDMPPELTGKCHTGPVYVSYWDGWLRLECGQCRKPIGRIAVKTVSKITEAEMLGYKLIKASPFEVGLTKNGQGLKTWWANDFNGTFPDLDHPLVQEAIQINEQMEK